MKKVIIKFLLLVLGVTGVFMLSSCFGGCGLASCLKGCFEIRGGEEVVDGSEYGIHYSLSEDGESYCVADVGYKETVVTIPETYQGKPVTGISNGAFAHWARYYGAGCDTRWGYMTMNIQSLTLPKTIKVIESGAFVEGNSGSKCANLYYGGTLEDWLNIDFGSSPINDTTTLYFDGVKVADLVIPENVKVINANAFACYQGLTSVTFHENLSLIEARAFAYCDNLESLVFPCKDLTVGELAFAGCNGLTDITFTGEKLTLEDGAFEFCTNLGEVNWNDVSLTVIPAFAFYECGSLKEIVIPATVVAIRDYAFKSCYNLETVYNLSALNIVAGSLENGHVAEHALTVKTAPEEEIPPTVENPPVE